EWRWKLRGTWNTPWYNTSLSLAWRYFSAVDLDAAQSNPALQSGSFPPDQHIGTQNYIDLAFGWNIDKNWTLYAGVNNVFDRDPPTVSPPIPGLPFANATPYPQISDRFGRISFLTLPAKF